MTETGTQDGSIALHRGDGETGLEADSPALLADPVGFLTAGYRAHGALFRVRNRGMDWNAIAGIEANDFFWQNTADWSYGRAGAGFRSQFGAAYVTQLDGAPHLRKRRQLKTAFSMESVARQVPTMAVEAGRFLDRVAEWGADANEWIPALLLAMNRAALIHTGLTREESRDAIRFEGEMIYGVGVSSVQDAWFGRPEYVALRERVFALVDRELAARASGKREDDALQALLDQDAGTSAHEELRNDAYLLLAAGIHNTARLVIGILERLSREEAWVDGLREELRGCAPDSFARGLGAFPRLKATLQEAERLHPGGVFLRRRPVRDLEFAGKVIRAGAPVMQVHSLPHFLPEYFPDPFRFRPERWMEGEPPPRKAVVNFGGGAHICLGMNLTRVQAPIIVAEIVRRFEWRLGYEPSFAYRVDPGILPPAERADPIVLVKSRSSEPDPLNS